MERYDRIAETIATNSRMQDVLMLLQLAPYGVVCMLNPRIDSNDYSGDHPLNSTGLLGLDYLSEPMRSKVEYHTLSHNGQMTLSGPKTMNIPCRNKEDSNRAGGCRYHGYSASVLEARLPIHVPGYTMQVPSDGGTAKGAYPYWGFAIATIHLEALIETSGAFGKFADQELDFQLTRKVTLGGSSEAAGGPAFVILAESPGFSTVNRVSHSTKINLDPYLPGESWTMTVSYATTAPWQVWVIPLLVIMCCCISFLVFKILLQKQDRMAMAAVAMAQESKVQTERNMTAYFAHELRNRKSRLLELFSFTRAKHSSHDCFLANTTFPTALSAMDSALKAMPEEDMSGPGKELIAGMRICSDFMSTIMNNLLDVRKMEEGELTLKRRPVNLDLLVESLHRMFQPNVRPGVEFVWRSSISSRDRQWVIGDSHRLQQIFANVITNALKYTTSGSVTLSIGWEDEYLSASEGSQQTRATSNSTNPDSMTEDHADETLTSRTTNNACPMSKIDFSGEIKASEVSEEVKTSELGQQQWPAAPKPKGIMKVPKSTPTTLNDPKQDDTMPSRIRFECADTGPGILKSHQSELFKKFVQRGGAPGTGLGLAIAKHLVELMGGEIFYESDPTTRPGSTCVVLLPLPPCHAPPKSKAEKRQQEAEEEKNDPLQDEISILIVDDIKMNRMMLKRRFQKGVAPNCTITEAPNGETALEILERESFDVVIVDQFMEDAGGVLLGTDTILAMRRQGISSLVIGCSGNDIEKDFLEAGADHCWQKPLPDNGTIIRQFRKHMDRSFRRQKAES